MINFIKKIKHDLVVYIFTFAIYFIVTEGNIFLRDDWDEGGEGGAGY